MKRAARRRLLFPFCRGGPVLANALRRTFAIVAFLIVFALPAFAGSFEDAVGKFATDDFSDTEEAIGVVAASGNPLAYPIISALQEERLMADPDTKKVYIKGTDGKNIDAATGAAVASIPDSASAVRLNNRLRRTVEAHSARTVRNGSDGGTRRGI